MSLTLSFLKSPKKTADTIILTVYDKNRLSPSASQIDKKAKGFIAQALKADKNFAGKAGQAMVLPLPAGTGYARAVLAGLGEAGKADAPALETAGGKLFPVLKNLGVTHLTWLADFDKGMPVKGGQAAAHLAMGLALRSYSFTKYKAKGKDDKTAALKSIDMVLDDSAGATKAYKELSAAAQGVFLARTLTNEPPNVLYPESYAAIIGKELRPLGIAIEVLDDKKMQKLGFGAHLAVGMGSARPPRVVIMRWNGATGSSKSKSAKSKPPIAFVGKGVTFDTGGISIKPAAGMEDMIMDMGGSATVVGLMKTLALRKAKVDAVGIVGLAENMPSDRAYRPGDIITSLAGKTIEIINTDAEGRLVLADALTYVQRTCKPRLIIDLATLTGAIMVALGLDYAGIFANDDALWDRLDKSAKATGEKAWRMPLDDSFRKEMESAIADLKNLGSVARFGGACSAAGFLSHFVEAKTPWAHIDIAGTAWSKADKPLHGKGATGYGVRMLDRLVRDYYEA